MTGSVPILSQEELRRLVPLDVAAVDCIEQAFAKLASGRVVMPPVLRLDIAEHNGEVDVKTAYVPGLDTFAIKISPGFFDNPSLGLPSVSGLMVVLNAETGLVEALLLDRGYLTDIRTAAAGAVAARWLSREDSRVAGILGAGVQARLQLEALTLVRGIERALVWARDAGKAAACATEMADKLGIAVEPAPSAEVAVRAADIVVTTTPSRKPLIAADWLHPGLHVTAMGSDAEHKNEIAPDAIVRADLYVCDRQSQCAVIGELHHAIAAGAVPAEHDWPELGEVVAGLRQGRAGAAEITICDLTGTGIQDTAIAALARERAASTGR
jgi:ectoine utilization protein EutC